MASFDIIDAAGHGYRDAWRHRRYLARLSFAPLLIQIACLLGVTQIGTKGDVSLREGLLMLPALFSQGWMLSHYVRFLFLDQSWPFRPTGNAASDRAMLAGRMRGISAGTLLFTLPQYLLYGFFQINIELAKQVMPAGPNAGAAVIAHGPPPAAAPATSAAALALIVILLWSIRLVCLYVPAALNMPLRPVLQRLKGFQVSFCLLGTILVCFVPLYVMVELFMAGLNDWARPDIATGVAAILVASAALIAGNFVVTGGIAYGLRVMLGRAPKPGQ